MSKLYYVRGNLVLGSVVRDAAGYRWFPYTSARQPSRKSWPTPDDAIRGRVRGGRLVLADNPQKAIMVAQGKA